MTHGRWRGWSRQSLAALGLMLVGVAAVATPRCVAAPNRAAEPLTITVMSFNIRGDYDHGESTAWSTGLEGGRRVRVARQIRRQSPDVIGLQEALPNQLADLASRLGGYAHYGVGRDDGETLGEACPIFWRTELFERGAAGTFWLSETPAVAGSRYPGAACARVASWVELKTLAEGASRTIVVLNTHWDHVSGEARGAAARQISAWLLAKEPDTSFLVLGDLNASETSAAYAVLRARPGNGAWLADCFRKAFPVREENEATYHGFRGAAKGSRIDFVFCTPDFKVLNASILRPAAGAAPSSDHFPVMATVSIGGERPSTSGAPNQSPAERGHGEGIKPAAGVLIPSP